jgi:hypothetical protein
MSKRIIQINHKLLSKNNKDGLSRPVFVVKFGEKLSKTYYAKEVKILGESKMIYSDKPLPCGAKAWIETESEIVLVDKMTLREVKAYG